MLLELDVIMTFLAEYFGKEGLATVVDLRIK